MRRADLSTRGHEDSVERAVAILRGLRYFGSLAEPLLTSLVQRSAQVELEAGEVLIREGDLQAREMYVLLQGVIAVQSHAALIHRLEQPGDVVGELAVLLAPPRTADVVAESAARVLAVRPEVIALPEFAGAAAAFYTMLSHSLAAKLRLTATQSRQQIDRVAREAATDALTGLANRKRLDEFLTELLSAAGGRKQFALIMADVDRFKEYNDANGHPRGDAVLVKVGMILQAGVRQGDLAARYGGEEFALVLPNCEQPDALRIAEKLRATIERESFSHAGQLLPGRVTATFGVAVSDGMSPSDEVLRRADEALYRGKAAGRNCVVPAGNAVAT